MQKSNNPKYRDQRRNPKVIVPESFHKDGYANDFTIELEDAPLAHSAVQFYLRDAQYATLAKLDEAWNEVSNCAITCKHTSSPKVLLRVYHHQYLTRAPLHVLALLWIRDLSLRARHTYQANSRLMVH
jgi:hypothetical protein